MNRGEALAGKLIEGFQPERGQVEAPARIVRDRPPVHENVRDARRTQAVQRRQLAGQEGPAHDRVVLEHGDAEVISPGLKEHEDATRPGYLPVDERREVDL